MAKETYIIGDAIRNRVPNVYQLNLLAARRAHAIERGSDPRLSADLVKDHKPTVIALMEIEAGLIGLDYMHNQKDIEQHWKAEKEQRGE